MILVHRGNSMSPTLRDGDLVCVENAAGNRPRPGDIVCVEDLSGTLVIHRVLRRETPGLETRGDANCRVDPWTVPDHRVRGTVAWAARGPRTWRPAGGLHGRLHALVLQLLLPLRRGPLRMVVAPVQWLAGHLRLARLLAVRCVSTHPDPEAHRIVLTRGRRVIGRLDARSNTWSIHWPYSLLLDPRRLTPSTPSAQSVERDGPT